MKRPSVATPLRWALIVLAAAVAVAPPSYAGQCETLGVNAPAVTTLMASPTNPNRQAWIVTPNCGWQVMDMKVLSTGEITLNTADLKKEEWVERVESLPSELTELELSAGPLRSVVSVHVSSASRLKIINMHYSTTTKVDLVLPESLKHFGSFKGALDTLDNINFPAGMTSLFVQDTAVRSLRNVKLPTALNTLRLTGNNMPAIDFTLPSRLQVLVLDSNPLKLNTLLVLPTTLLYFRCNGCRLTSIQGVRWPASIQTIIMENNALTMIEIRRSDVRKFEALDTLTASVSQASCKTANAEATTIKGIPVCVIEDDVFDSLYQPDTNSPGVTSAPGPELPTESSSRSGSEDDADGSSTPTNSNGSDGKGGGGNGGGGNDSDGNATAKGSASTDPSGKRVPIDGDSDGTDTAQGSSSSMSATLLLVIGGVGSLLAVLVATIGYRVCVTRRRRESDSTKYYGEAISTPLGEDPTIHESSTQEYLSNDVRNDKALLPFRIERRDVQLGKVIARGGYGLVYRGRYDGRDVAIKQMLPNAVRDDAMLASFMDEIRLCASLDHPKIVQFVGITWSSLRDLSVLTEFMAGGDLYELLYQASNRPHPDHWRQSWSTKTVANLPCKLQMALDVAEAVVYLHSFASPIIHRDLKSKNVLLDTRGHPKLSDFGISRELAVDETMTSEVGTSAWIAPEVLRGERYSEQADVYSLGVVLVELDRCCHPYAGEPVLLQPHQPQPYPQSSVAVNSTQSFASRSAQIAVLVSTGRLRPSLSADAPREVKELVGRCLANRPEDRVNSMEVCYELRQLLKRRG